MLKQNIVFLFVGLLGLPAIAEEALPVFSCGGGQVVVKVDPLQRKNVKVEVNDKGVKQYLAKFTHNFLGTTGGNIEDGNYYRSVAEGIFHPNQFRGFLITGTTTQVETLFNGVLSVTQEIYILPEAGGLKIVIARNGIDFLGGGEGGGNTPRVTPMREQANWFFQNCVGL